MRLLLDSHISASRVGAPLRDFGHDVKAVNEDRSLDKWGDNEILALAASEDRILVTFNARDFARIAREWAEASRGHSGCAIIVGIDHSQFGLVIRRLHSVLSARPEPKNWRNYTCFVSRSP